MPGVQFTHPNCATLVDPLFGYAGKRAKRLFFLNLMTLAARLQAYGLLGNPHANKSKAKGGVYYALRRITIIFTA